MCNLCNVTVVTLKKERSVVLNNTNTQQFKLCGWMTKRNWAQEEGWVYDTSAPRWEYRTA